MKIIFYRFLIYLSLILQICGFFFITDRITMQSKIPISIIIQERNCQAYVNNKDKLFHAGKNDTIIIQTHLGNALFYVDSLKQEPSHMVLHIHYIEGHSTLIGLCKGDTYISGFIFTGKKKLRDLIVEKV